MSFISEIGGLIVANVEFGDDILESKVEALCDSVAKTATAALKFEAAIGEDADGKAAKGGLGLIKLASTLGVAFDSLTPEQVAEFKTTIADVYENPDPVIDAAGQELFNTSLDAIAAAQDLSDYVAEQTEGASGGE